MILTCQKCSTQYYLARQQLAPDGRKLKCSKCKTIWFQEYVVAPKVAFDKFNVKSPNLKKNQIFLPAVISKRQPIWTSICITFLFLLVLGLTMILFQNDLTKKYPGISYLYDKVGMPSISGMKIHAVEISHNKNNQIDINGVIENNSKIHKRVPPIVIFLFNENNTLLKTVFIPAPPRYLNQGSKYAFYRRIKNNFKTQPKAVSVTLASGVEVFLYSLF